MVAVAKAPRRNLLRVDPTRTTQLRLRFMADVKRRFETIRKAVLKLVGEEDAFGLGPPTITGLVANAGRWAFQTDPEKLASFQAWLKEQVDIGVLTSANGQMPWTETYIKSAYKSAAVRSYAEVRGKLEPSTGIDGQSGRARFLAESFDTSEAVDKIRLLSTRSYEQLRAVTAQMSTQMGQILGAGMAHGEGPRAVAKKMSDEIAGITKKRALVIARTEIIYAHSEGQLDSMERLGVAEVGVMVEWSHAGDDRVCAACEALGGMIMTIQEARGLIPRHPNCRCAFIPANVGEGKDGQKRSKASIQDAVAKSLRKERPKAKDPRAASTWAGADKKFADKKDKFTKGRGPLRTVKPKPKPKITPIERVKALPTGEAMAVLEDGEFVATPTRVIEGVVAPLRKEVTSRGVVDLSNKFDAYANKLPVTDIPISDLWITQDRIDPKNVTRIITEFDKAKLNPLKVVQLEGGEYIVLDGHHTLTAQWAMGAKTVPVKILKL